MCKNHSHVKKEQLETDNLYEVWKERGERYELMTASEIAVALKEDDEPEEGGEDFLPGELILASALGIAVAKVGEEAQDILLNILEQEGVSALEKAVDKVRPVMGEAFNYGSTQKAVEEAIDNVIKRGAASIGVTASTMDSLATKRQVLEGMVDSSKYYTNQYFNTQVAPRLFKQIDDIIEAGGDVNTAGYTAIRETMEARLKSTPYWRVVANSAASRSYHYGVVKAGMVTGRRGYKYVAIIDERTSDICRDMNGREFWLADAERQIIRSATSTGEEIKENSPWLAPTEIIGKTNNELVAQGTILPPLHGNCRSTITLI